jgi:hypothetical protein
VVNRKQKPLAAQPNARLFNYDIIQNVEKSTTNQKFITTALRTEDIEFSNYKISPLYDIASLMGPLSRSDLMLAEGPMDRMNEARQL